VDAGAEVGAGAAGAGFDAGAVGAGVDDGIDDGVDAGGEAGVGVDGTEVDGVPTLGVGAPVGVVG